MAAARNGFQIVRATVADSERIVQFLRKAFYKHEPLNLAMGLPEESSIADELDTVSYLHEGTSLLALSHDGTMLGVCINGEYTSEEADTLESKVAACTCRRYSKILKFICTVERNADVWNKTNVSRALSVQAIAVDDSARGRGIGKALVERTIVLAKEEGIPLFRADCSSHYSAQLAEKVGMECVYTLPYSEYTDETGKPIFDPPSPHKEMKTYIYKLN